VCLFLFQDPVRGGTAALVSWPLNLLVAEWLIRRNAGRIPVAQPALTA
jgi:hypothetical protein